MLGRSTLLTAVIILAGCPRPGSARICNNTGDALTVITEKGQKVRWAKNESLKLGHEGIVSWQELEWRSLGLSGPNAPTLVVDAKGTRKAYVLDWRGLTQEHKDGETFPTMFFQLQPDARLFAVRANSRCPLPAPPAQPSGLPISPR